MRLVKYRGRYYVYAEGKRRALYTADRVTAEQKFEDFKRNVQRKKETIGEIVEAYLEAKKDKPSINGMVDAWKAANHFFNRFSPTHLSNELCSQYCTHRKGCGVSNGTIRKELGVIRQAIKWHNPQSNPEIELPAAPPPKERHLTREEYEALKAACHLPHLRLFVQLALGTGARKGAILDLTWEQIDFERGQIRLSKGPQTNKRRAIVSIDETLVEALKTAKKDSLSPYVISYSGGRVKDIKKGFMQACKRAGLKDVTPHTLRHTAAVWMAEGGISMDEIAQFLGHSTPALTYKVYARFSPSYLKKAASFLKV